MVSLDPSDPFSRLPLPLQAAACQMFIWNQTSLLSPRLRYPVSAVEQIHSIGLQEIPVLKWLLTRSSSCIAHLEWIGGSAKAKSKKWSSSSPLPTYTSTFYPTTSNSKDIQDTTLMAPLEFLPLYQVGTHQLSLGVIKAQQGWGDLGGYPCNHHACWYSRSLEWERWVYQNSTSPPTLTGLCEHCCILCQKNQMWLLSLKGEIHTLYCAATFFFSFWDIFAHTLCPSCMIPHTRLVSYPGKVEVSIASS